jgi:hypothetical protein
MAAETAEYKVVKRLAARRAAPTQQFSGYGWREVRAWVLRNDRGNRPARGGSRNRAGCSGHEAILALVALGFFAGVVGEIELDTSRSAASERSDFSAGLDEHDYTCENANTIALESV